MADYKVTDTELTSIANAIRTKGGTQAQLEFPTGFVSAVQAIPTGGGGEVQPLTPYVYDYNNGYVVSNQFECMLNGSRYDAYQVEAGHSYFITLGSTVGNRFRAVFLQQDVTQETAGVFTGTQIVSVDGPPSNSYAPIFNASQNGYIYVSKINDASITGLKTYVFDFTDIGVYPITN